MASTSSSSAAKSSGTSTPEDHQLDIIVINNTLCYYGNDRTSSVVLWRPKKSVMLIENLFDLLSKFCYGVTDSDHLSADKTYYMYEDGMGNMLLIKDQTNLDNALQQTPITIQVDFDVEIYHDLVGFYGTARKRMGHDYYIEIQEVKLGEETTEPAARPVDDSQPTQSSASSEDPVRREGGNTERAPVASGSSDSPVASGSNDGSPGSGRVTRASTRTKRGASTSPSTVTSTPDKKKRHRE